MKYESFAVRCRGASHVKKNTICQDSIQQIQDLHTVTAGVADGHGSAPYFRSDKGSKFAVEICCRKLFDFLHDSNLISLSESEQDEKIQKLTDEIVNEWRVAVRDDFLGTPFTEEEMQLVPEADKENYIPFSESQQDELSQEDLKECFEIENPSPKIRSLFKAYGATLICIGFCDDFGVGLHIGDGKCVALYSNGTTDEPIPWDEKCHLNRCTSICDERAKEEFRHHIWKENLPVAVFAASDGIDDTFADRLHWFYLHMAMGFTEPDFRKCVSEVEAQLPEFSERGSQDDMSVCGILDIGKLRTMTEIIQEEIHDFERTQQLAQIQQKLTELEYRRNSVQKLLNLSIDEQKKTASLEKLTMLEQEIEKFQKQKAVLLADESEEESEQSDFFESFGESGETEESQRFEESEEFEHFEKSPELVTDEDDFDDETGETIKYTALSDNEEE